MNAIDKKVVPINANPAAIATAVAASEAPAAEASTADQIIPIGNIDMFAGLILDWHSRAVSDIEHLLDIPEDAEVMFQQGEDAANLAKDDPAYEVNAVKLSGDAYKAFQFGVQSALIIMAKLPFTATPVEEDGKSDASNDAPVA